MPGGHHHFRTLVEEATLVELKAQSSQSSQRGCSKFELPENVDARVWWYSAIDKVTDTKLTWCDRVVAHKKLTYRDRKDDVLVCTLKCVKSKEAKTKNYSRRNNDEKCSKVGQAEPASPLPAQPHHLSPKSIAVLMVQSALHVQSLTLSYLLGTALAGSKMTAPYYKH